MTTLRSIYTLWVRMRSSEMRMECEDESEVRMWKEWTKTDFQKPYTERNRTREDQ